MRAIKTKNGLFVAALVAFLALVAGDLRTIVLH
jgi:hypothetical protein